MTEHSISSLTDELMLALKAAGKDFSAHSIFSPSGSSMWANCSGSLIPNLFAPDNAGIDAATGTVAHSVGEEWLKSGERPDHLIGETRTIVEGDQTFEIVIDETMLEYVEQYVSWCINLPGLHFVETRIDHSDLTPLKRQGGTADHAACTPGELVITDLKYGQGVLVSAKNNTQGLIYAYGFFRKYDGLFDFQTIRIRIAQPRLNNFDEWVITRKELLEWAAWIKERAYAAWCKDAKRTPSQKACRFCKIRKDCTAHAVFAEHLVDGVFDNLDAEITQSDMEDLADRIDSGTFNLTPVTLGTLTTPQKATLLTYRSMIEGWFKDLHTDLEGLCLSGVDVPGFKVVEGRSLRVFTDSEAAASSLEFFGLQDDVIRPRGMITPAKAETALIAVGYKRKDLPILLGGLVTKPPGRRTMVQVTDKRKAAEAPTDNVFDDLDSEL